MLDSIDEDECQSVSQQMWTMADCGVLPILSPDTKYAAEGIPGCVYVLGR